VLSQCGGCYTGSCNGEKEIKLARPRKEKVEKNFHPIIDWTQADIDTGTAQNRWDCIIVRAIQRKFPEAIRVRVDTERIAFTMADKDRRISMPTPPEVIENVIKLLDLGQRHAIAPGSFIPQEVTSAPVEHSKPATKKRARDHARSEKAKGNPSYSRNDHRSKRFKPECETEFVSPTPQEEAVIYRPR
jgi:hypothetical protein